MTVNEKMLKAVRSAAAYLENSMTALSKKDDASFARSIWHVVAELEYALFLFSITFLNESDLSRWKPNPELRKIEVDPMLVEAKNLLDEAERSLVNERLPDAYKSVYNARHYMLKVQEDISKKRRETLKKK